MTSGAPVDSDEISLLRLVNVFLRHRLSMVVSTLAGGFIVGLLSLLGHRTYTASASFLPQSGSRTTNLGGLAAQFGVALPGAEPSQSPTF